MAAVVPIARSARLLGRSGVQDGVAPVTRDRHLDLMHFTASRCISRRASCRIVRIFASLPAAHGRRLALAAGEGVQDEMMLFP